MAANTERIFALIKKALPYAFGITAFIETVMAIAGFSMKDLMPNCPWWIHLMALVFAFFVIVVIVCVALRFNYKTSIRITVGGNDICVTKGDLFACKGLKLIPFNEWFDTKVDDIIISRASLNGKFILEHVEDPSAFQAIVSQVGQTALKPPAEIDGRLKYELGTIKCYGDYLLLAFSHFNELNEAHLTMAEYEACLMNMWRELSRVYAGKPIYLPLLGSGITRFDDVPVKTCDELLRCMLCTLRATGVQFQEQVTIVVTDKTAGKLHLYELKDLF